MSYTDHEIAEAEIELRDLQAMSRDQLDRLYCGEQDARADRIELLEEITLPRDYHLAELEWISFRAGFDRATVTLRDGDSAEDPSTTKRRRIYGPAVVTYDRFPDGIDAKVEVIA